MNTKTFIAAVALTMLAGTNFAAEYTNFPLEPSVASRANVIAELEVARATGELDEPSAEYGSFSFDEISSHRTRMEAVAARKNRMQSLKIFSGRHNTGNYVGG